MTDCEYEGCCNHASYYDSTDSQICSQCMEREISEGADPDDFERI